MNDDRRRARRALTLVILAGLLVLPATVLAACGDGNKAAVAGQTLYPSPGASTVHQKGGQTGQTGSPSPGTSARPSSNGGSGGGSNGSGGSSGSSSSASGSGSGGSVSDQDIRGGILVRISQEPSLSNIDVKVKVHTGTVILTGRVKTAKQKRLVEHIAVTQPGVKKVVSYIAVDGGAGY